jgi:hypothetical protein
MNSRQEQERAEALKALEEKFIMDQLADLLYLQRRRVSSVSMGSGLLDIVILLGAAAYVATAPSREQIRERIQRGLLDDAVARERFREQFKRFINDLNDEEKDRLINSRVPITQTINYYIARNSHITLSDSLINRYREEERTSVGQDRLVVQQNISAVRAMRQAAAELPKILPTAAQLQGFNHSVNAHRQVLENNRPSDAKMFAALALGSMLTPLLGPFVMLAAVVVMAHPKLLNHVANKAVNTVVKSRFFSDFQASHLSSESERLVNLGSDVSSNPNKNRVSR